MHHIQQLLSLALAFTSTMRQWLTPEQLQMVVARNATPAYADACATHDFCDANMAMLEVFRRQFEREPLLSASESAGAVSRALVLADTHLWNGAWDLARGGEFDPARIQAIADARVVDVAAQAALDAACREIQEYLGVHSGDFAGTYFSGDSLDTFKSILAGYLDAQRRDLNV